VRTFELERLKAHCIIHGPLPGPARPDPGLIVTQQIPAGVLTRPAR
jgi:hypothetical protein